MIYIKKRPDTGTLLSILIIAVICCYLIAFGIINFLGFAQFCTTDMYEDTLVARLMWEQKTLFPKNFLFGNQFYVIATPVLAAIFYGITGSMNTAMALATTVMSFLILLSLYWMAKPFVKQRCIRLAILLAMLCVNFGPNCITLEDGQLFFVMCSFYACYLISFFVLMGDYARAREREELRPLAFAVALLLSFCTGMQSLRQTCVSMLPILCFEFLCIFLRIIKKQPLELKHMSTLRALSYLAANVAGVIFINMLGVKRNEIYYGQSIFSGASLSEKLKATHDAYLTVSGLEYAKLGLNFFYTVIFIFFAILLISALVLLIYRKDSSSAPAVFIYLCLISIVAVIAASFVTSVKLRPIYLFPYYTLPALSLIVIGKHLKGKTPQIACLLLCVVAALNLHFSYGSQIQSGLDGSFEDEIQQTCDFAIENGYEYIYGAHSGPAISIAAYSDGKLIAGCWDDIYIFKLSPHINIKDIYHLSDYSKALFIIQDFELPLAMYEISENGTELYLQADYGYFSVYTSSRQLLYPISENIFYAEYFPEYN